MLPTRCSSSPNSSATSVPSPTSTPKTRPKKPLKTKGNVGLHPTPFQIQSLKYIHSDFYDDHHFNDYSKDFKEIWFKVTGRSMVTFYRRLLLAPEIVSDFYLNRVGHDSKCQNKRQFSCGDFIAQHPGNRFRSS